MVRTRAQIVSELDEAIGAADGERVAELSRELSALPATRVFTRIAELRLEQAQLAEQLADAAKIAEMERLRSMNARQAIRDAERALAQAQRDSGSAENRAAIIRARQRTIESELGRITPKTRPGASPHAPAQPARPTPAQARDRLTVREALTLGVLVVGLLAGLGGAQDLRLGLAILAGGGAGLVVLAWFGWYGRHG